jgi:hypothetical protein
MKAKGAVRWKLKAIMDEREIGTVQLATFLDVLPGTVSTWRKSKYFPNITEERWIQIYNAINQLCDIHRMPGCKIQLSDLVEFCVEEMRDFESSDLKYVSDRVRKKSKLSKSSKEKKKDIEDKDVVAA